MKLKKLIILLLLLFFCLSVQASDYLFNPNTIKSMELDLTVNGSGTITGEINENDSLELKILTFASNERQEVVSKTETLIIGGQEITAVRETVGENEYAVFTINDLSEFVSGSENNFSYTINARLNANALIGVQKDFDLSKGINSFNDFLLESQNIEVNDPELIGKTAIEFQSNSLLETIQEISEWVYDNIEYDYANYYAGVFSAKETYFNRAGVCDEFANLTAAFLRIKGIPTKYNVGISFDGYKWGNHGWLEAFVPGQGWVGVDSTYGEAAFLDATHISFAKLYDINEAVDRITVTQHLSVTILKEEPVIEILNYEKFSNLVKVSLSEVPELSASQEFEFEAVIENLNETNFLVPINLSAHNEFTVENSKKIILLEPKEKKTVSWQLKSPEKADRTQSFLYGYSLSLPDQTIDGNFLVNFSAVEGKTIEGSNVSIDEVSPLIDNEVVVVKVVLTNNGTLDGNATIILSYSGKDRDYFVMIPAGTTQTFSYNLNNVSTNILVSIKSDESKEIEIPFTPPKNDRWNNTAPEETTGEPSENDGVGENQLIEQGTGNNIDLPLELIAGVIAVIVILGIVGFVLVKKKA
ncbi:MAG: transglutaminase-like domain-containing protein [archaeon]